MVLVVCAASVWLWRWCAVLMGGGPLAGREGTRPKNGTSNGHFAENVTQELRVAVTLGTRIMRGVSPENWANIRPQGRPPRQMRSIQRIPNVSQQSEHLLTGCDQGANVACALVAGDATKNSKVGLRSPLPRIHKNRPGKMPLSRLLPRRDALQ